MAFSLVGYLDQFPINEPVGLVTDENHSNGITRIIS